MNGRRPAQLVRSGGDTTGTHQGAATALLRDLGAALHWAAQPAPLIESRLRAIGRALGVQVDVFVLQGFLAIESKEGPLERVELERIDFDTHWNLTRTNDLVALCADLANGRLGVPQGRAELDRIMAEPRRYGKVPVTIGYGVYGAAVAVRVGGAWLEALAGGIIGLLAGAIHFGTLNYRSVDLQKSFLGALVGGLAALALTLLLPPFDTSRALFGGITLLVPAMVLTLGTYELANDALESGVARLAYGLLRFLMLGFGMAVALRLFPLFAAVPEPFVAKPLPRLLVLAIVAAGGVALTACIQGRRRDLPWIVFATVLAFGIQEATKVVAGGRGSPMTASFILGVAAHLFGRMRGKIPATVVIPGLLQLAPGFLGTQAVFDLLGAAKVPSSAAPGDLTGFTGVMLTALQLVTGLLVADLLMGRKTRERIEGKATQVH